MYFVLISSVALVVRVLEQKMRCGSKACCHFYSAVSDSYSYSVHSLSSHAERGQQSVSSLCETREVTGFISRGLLPENLLTDS